MDIHKLAVGNENDVCDSTYRKVPVVGRFNLSYRSAKSKYLNVVPGLILIHIIFTSNPQATQRVSIENNFQYLTL